MGKDQELIQLITTPDPGYQCESDKSQLDITNESGAMVQYDLYSIILPLSKGSKIVFQDLLKLNAGQKHCRMLQREHSAILSTFIKLPFIMKTFVSYIFEWPFYTGFIVWFERCCLKNFKMTAILNIKTKRF